MKTLRGRGEEDDRQSVRDGTGSEARREEEQIRQETNGNGSVARIQTYFKQD